jgi:hypothetical protein
MMEGKLTVYFDPPFWVGIFEKIENNHCQAARQVFGSEPTEPELIKFALENYNTLRFSQPALINPEQNKSANYKRRMREIRGQMLAPEKSTKAQQIIRKEYETNSNFRKNENRHNRFEEQRQKYRLRKVKQAEKHRGH